MWTQLALNINAISNQLKEISPAIAGASIVIGALMMYFGKNNRESGKNVITWTFVSLGCASVAGPLVSWFVGIFTF